MALFTRDSPETKITRDLEVAVGKQHDHEKRLRLAEAKLVECLTAVEQAHDAGDDKLDIALANKRAAEDKVAALIKWLAQDEKAVADLQEKADKIADGKMRVATAAAIEQIVVDLIEAGKIYNTGAAELTAAARRASDVALDAHGLVAFSMNTAAEIPAAVSMIAEVLRHRAAQTLNGSAPSGLPMPEQIPTKAKPVEPPSLERVFLIKHVKFTDADGNLHRLPKINVSDLLPEHAARALKHTWAIAMSDPRVKQLGGSYGAQIPPVHLCEDLDTGTPSDTPSIIHGVFTPMDRGPTVYGVLPVQPVDPMTASRTEKGQP
jgi:hypothetical protein